MLIVQPIEQHVQCLRHTAPDPGGANPLHSTLVRRLKFWYSVMASLFWRRVPQLHFSIYFSQTATVKRPYPSVTGTTVSGVPFQSRLFYMTDRYTGFRFLIDTGAEISVIPPPAHQSETVQPQATPTSKRLTHVHLPSILVFSVDINSSECLSNFDLMASIKQPQLVDRMNSFYILGISDLVHSLGVRPVIPRSPFTDILKCFPSLNKPSQLTRTAPHSICHN